MPGQPISTPRFPVRRSRYGQPATISHSNKAAEGENRSARILPATPSGHPARTRSSSACCPAKPIIGFTRFDLPQHRQRSVAAAHADHQHREAIAPVSLIHRSQNRLPAHCRWPKRPTREGLQHATLSISGLVRRRRSHCSRLSARSCRVAAQSATPSCWPCAPRSSPPPPAVASSEWSCAFSGWLPSDHSLSPPPIFLSSPYLLDPLNDRHQR